jgi:hypothetical protein
MIFGNLTLLFNWAGEDPTASPCTPESGYGWPKALVATSNNISINLID